MYKVLLVLASAAALKRPQRGLAVRGGEHHVRVAFTNDVARLEEALVRLERFLARQTGG